MGYNQRLRYGASGRTRQGTGMIKAIIDSILTYIQSRKVEFWAFVRIFSGLERRARSSQQGCAGAQAFVLRAYGQ